MRLPESLDLSGPAVVVVAAASEYSRPRTAAESSGFPVHPSVWSDWEWRWSQLQ